MTPKRPLTRYLRGPISHRMGSPVSGKHDDGANRTPVTKVSLRIPVEMRYRPLAIDLVSTLTEHVETADRAFRNHVVTAFGEAFNNIVIHGYRDRIGGEVEIQAEMGGDWITLKLIDAGAEIDFASATPPDLESLPESGMGIFMICSFMDEVTYRPGARNVLSMTKRSRARPLSHRFSAEEG